MRVPGKVRVRKAAAGAYFAVGALSQKTRVIEKFGG